VVPVVVTSPDELVAALPHVLGFTPEESVVTIPLGSELPVARLDIPTTAEERSQAVESFTAAYARNLTAPRGALAIVCMTENRRAAAATSWALARGLEQVGIESPIRLWASADRWMDLNSGDNGARSVQSDARMAAEAAYLGKPPPAPSRSALSAALVGDRAPVAEVLREARVLDQEEPDAQRRWTVERLVQFQSDGYRLSDSDAARLLVALEAKPTRDALWADMSAHNIASHIDLWTDMTRRAPDEVRTPAASLLAFAHWLEGDGAKGWVALDQIPDGSSYTMAGLTATVLGSGIHPGLWEHTKALFVDSDAAETFLPDRANQHHHHRAPTSPSAPDRRAPGI